ncbi:MAG: GNAT family N-acetyltransferase [Erysipelotrichaceae bacterium]|nr:GNAT family N-acetyltransferase [Erysipelotrichaceae bacterium]
MELINVDESLIELTSDFAQSVFIDYYTPLNGSEHANYMADMFLSQKAIKELLGEGAVFKLVMDDNKPVAYTEYKKDGDRVFLSKLYAHKDYRGRKLGDLMLNDCIEYTKSSGLNKIYLTVNKYNTPSYNIYLHKGFKVIDSVETDIGHGYIMDDYIMELTI